MDITRAMMLAARRAEFDFYQQQRGLGEWFRPMPDAQLHAVLEAAIGAIQEDTDPAPEPETEDVEAIPALINPARIVRALKPRSKR